MTDLDARWIADIPSERALLGCLLLWPQATRDVWRTLRPSDFGRPAHEALAGVLAGWEGECNPQLVLAEVTRRGLGEVARILPELVSRATTEASAPLHAQDVLRAAKRRRLRELALRALQQADNDAVDVDEVALGLMSAAEDLAAERRAAAHVATAEEFMAGPTDYAWLVPNLLERRDRVIVTGGEGGGKSWWLRQLAVCTAYGIHPVTFARVPAKRTLVLDFENDPRRMRRDLRPMLALAARQGDPDGAGRLHVESRPAGIDLDSLEDVAWLTDTVVAARPDLVVLGPLYRMHRVSLDKEEAARAVTVVLDGLRERAGCALAVEAHAPHGIGGQRWWRPAGSSLFMRWPEFGLGLKPDQDGRHVDVVAWRGPRDERVWPRRMRRGNPGVTFPWLETEAVDPAWSA